MYARCNSGVMLIRPRERQGHLGPSLDGVTIDSSGMSAVAVHGWGGSSAILLMRVCAQG